MMPSKNSSGAGSGDNTDASSNGANSNAGCASSNTANSGQRRLTDAEKSQLNSSGEAARKKRGKK